MDFTLCVLCAYFEDCQEKEFRDGCYTGEEREDEVMD